MVVVGPVVVVVVLVVVVPVVVVVVPAAATVVALDQYAVCRAEAWLRADGRGERERAMHWRCQGQVSSLD